MGLRSGARTSTIGRRIGEGGGQSAAMTRQSSNSEESTHDVSLCVVIPTYRRAARLDRLLTALEPQITGKPDRRVVVVNDGSHDDAYAKVAERFQAIIDYVALPQNRGRGGGAKRGR